MSEIVILCFKNCSRYHQSNFEEVNPFLFSLGLRARLLNIIILVLNKRAVWLGKNFGEFIEKFFNPKLLLKPSDWIQKVNSFDLNLELWFQFLGIQGTFLDLWVKIMKVNDLGSEAWFHQLKLLLLLITGLGLHLLLHLPQLHFSLFSLFFWLLCSYLR